MQARYYGPVSVSASACYKLELYGKDWTIRASSRLPHTVL